MLRQLFITLTSLLLIMPSSLTAAEKESQGRPPTLVVLANVTEAKWSPDSRLQGLFRFAQVADIATEIEGAVTLIAFDAGQILRKGDILLELDTAFIKKDISIARSEQAELDAKIEKLKREVERLTALKRTNNTSRSAYDEAYYSHKSLRQQHKTAEQRIARLEISLTKSRVRAPFDGIVLARSKDSGDWSGKGEIIARLGSTDSMFVEVPIAENLLRYQSSAELYEVTIPSLGQTVQAEFDTLIPVADLRSKTVLMKLRLPWQPGMFENASAEVRVKSATAHKLRMVPRAALLQTTSGDTIYTVKDGRAKAVSVHIIARNAEHIIVDDEAVHAGMPVVIEGNDRLKPGQAVNVIEK